jgi:hypothetical protein
MNSEPTKHMPSNYGRGKNWKESDCATFTGSRGKSRVKLSAKSGAVFGLLKRLHQQLTPLYHPYIITDPRSHSFQCIDLQAVHTNLMIRVPDIHPELKSTTFVLARFQFICASIVSHLLYVFP